MPVLHTKKRYNANKKMILKKLKEIYSILVEDENFALEAVEDEDAQIKVSWIKERTRANDVICIEDISNGQPICFLSDYLEAYEPIIHDITYDILEKLELDHYEEHSDMFYN